MRWLGLRFVTNPTRAAMVARRRHHDMVYYLSDDGECSRAEQPDLEPTSLSVVMRRWALQGIDVVWGQSHAEVARVLQACKSDAMPTYVAIEPQNDAALDAGFSGKLKTFYGSAEFLKNDGIAQYRVKNAQRSMKQRRRVMAADAESSDDDTLFVPPQDRESAAYLAHWAKHEKLRRLEQRGLPHEVIARRLGLTN